jgi:hypothetical protein
MSSEGIRAAAAAFIKGTDKFFDEELVKIKRLLMENAHKPFLFLPIPSSIGHDAYAKFITSTLAGTRLDMAVVDNEIVVIARSKDMVVQGVEKYRELKFTSAINGFLGKQ